MSPDAWASVQPRPVRDVANQNWRWQDAPERLPALAGSCVHIWLAELAAWRGQHGALVNCLAVSERKRAARLVSPEQRVNWELTRALLRHLLAAQLRLPPVAVEFQYGALGKPALADGARGDLHFNLSHSSGLAVFTLTHSGAVGVDIEQVCARTANWRKIARKFLPPDEVVELDALDEAEGMRAFFACWTRHEAVAKARGGSIFAQRTTAELGGLKVTMLPDVPGFCAALATENPAPSIFCWRMAPGTTP